MEDAGNSSGGDAGEDSPADDGEPSHALSDAEVDASTEVSPDAPRSRRAITIAGVAIAALAVAVLLPVLFLGGGAPDAAPPRDEATTTSEAPAPVAVAAQPVARTWTAEEAVAINNFAVASMPADQQLQYGFYLMTAEEKAQWTALVERLAAGQPDSWIIRTVPAGTPLPPGTIILDDPTAIPGSSNTGAPAPPVPLDSVWDRLAWCEASGNWATNTGNSYSGGLQFLHSTWVSYGGREFAAHAHQATREQQIVIAERILASVGWRAWPACTRKLGLR
jgi:hypothetical protein